MINLKDVLHYYIGCDIMLPSEAGSSEPNIQNLTLPILSYYLHIDKSSYSELKPILRKIENMSDKEAVELTRLVVHKDEFNKVITFKNHFGDTMVKWGDKKEKYNASGERCWSGEQFNYLIKQGFDIFGLIPAGMAIDSGLIKMG